MQAMKLLKTLNKRVRLKYDRLPSPAGTSSESPLQRTTSWQLRGLLAPRTWHQLRPANDQIDGLKRCACCP
jgi:hypothetical protein